MKCSNCRCVIPDRSEYCLYCGQIIPLGDEATQPAGIGVTQPARRNRGARRPQAPYQAPVYTDGGFGGYDQYYNEYAYHSAPAYYRDDRHESGFDLILINDDGSFNLAKALVFFAGFNVIFILILLLLILVLLM